MLDIHPKTRYDTKLDDPITASFRSKWADLSLQHGTATALPEDVGLFAIPGGSTGRDVDDFTTVVRSRRAPVFVFEPDEAAAAQPARYCWDRPLCADDCNPPLGPGKATHSICAWALRTAPKCWRLQN